MAYPEPQYQRSETAKEYTKKYTLEKSDEVLLKQEDGLLGYISAGQFATTGSNIFTADQTINANLNVNGDINVNTIISASTVYQSGSTKFGNSYTNTHQFTGSVLITGSTTQIGNNTLLGITTLSGSVNISGAVDVYGSTNFHNHIITMTGSLYTSGSQVITGSLDVKGNINVASGSEFYLAGNKLFNYGQFSDTTTQSGSANTAYAMKLNTTDFAHEVSITNGSRITVVNTGVYNLQFSAQLANTANTNIAFDIWLAYTGSDVTNSNTQIDVNKSAGQLGRSVAAWNWMIPIKANDYVQIMWSCDASTGQLFATGSLTNPIRPAIPSVIATLTQIG